MVPKKVHSGHHKVSFNFKRCHLPVLFAWTMKKVELEESMVGFLFLWHTHFYPKLGWKYSCWQALTKLEGHDFTVHPRKVKVGFEDIKFLEHVKWKGWWSLFRTKCQKYRSWQFRHQRKKSDCWLVSKYYRHPRLCTHHCSIVGDNSENPTWLDQTIKLILSSVRAKSFLTGRWDTLS